MLYYKAKMLKAERFRRLTGLQKGTFAKMVEVLTIEKKKLHSKGGVVSGYQGVQHEHANTALPIKKTKLKPLTK